MKVIQFIVLVVIIALLQTFTTALAPHHTFTTIKSSTPISASDYDQRLLDTQRQTIHNSAFIQFHSELHFQTPTPGPFKVTKHHVLADHYIDQIITGHVIAVAGAATSYHTLISPQGCPGRNTTSETSHHNHCTIATNAGFFDMKTGACIGDIVSDGVIVQSVGGLMGGFGITHDGQMAIGYANKTMVDSKAFKQYVNGKGWIVKDGKDNVDKAMAMGEIGEDFIKLLAPRLAVGWDKDGDLMLFVVDGEEKTDHGVDLRTFAKIMLDYGAVEALNLDGGGSVTLVWNGIVCDSSGLHQAECEDMDLLEAIGQNGQQNGQQSQTKCQQSSATTAAINDGPYERPVTSVVCLK